MLRDLIGLIAMSSVSISALNSVAMRLQTVAGQDNVAMLQLTAAISALVGALVFVHRLLLKAKDDVNEQTKAGFLAVIAAKDQTLTLLTDDKQRLEIETSEMRDLMRKAGLAELTALNVARDRDGGGKP